jgi:hypothetical protein
MPCLLQLRPRFEFIACLLENMGPPYSSGELFNTSPTLTFHNCGRKYPTYADLCAYPDYLVSDTISLTGLLVTLERFQVIGLNVPFEKDPESKLNLEDWMERPVES